MGTSIKHAYVIAIVLALAIVGGSFLQSEKHAAAYDQLKKDVTASIADNNAKLQNRIDQFEHDRKITATPAVVSSLPKYVPLPQPIYMQPPEPTTSNVAGRLALVDAPSSNLPKQGSLVIPAESVQSFWQHEITCSEDAAKLETCKANLIEQTKLAKGPKRNFFSRLKSNSKLLVIGGGIVGAAICATGHCK